MKKIIIGLLVLCLLLGFQSAFADGTCGTNVKYTISGNTLTYAKSDSSSAAEWADDCRNAYNNNITIVKIADTIHALDAYGMFAEFTYVETMDLAKLDVSDVTNMSYMFSGCNFLEKLNVSGWNTSNVTDMSGMFYECYFLESLDLSRWNTSKVTNMSSMFSGCSFLKSLDLSRWNTSSVTNMYSMFNGCTFLESVNLSGWNTSSVTDMSDMFSGCSSLKSVNISGWNTSHVMNMGSMFSGCSSMTSLNLNGWDTSHVTDMGWMFSGCSSMTSLSLNKWDTSHVTDMGSMFQGCSSLTDINVSSWNTSHVMDMGWMFQACSSLKKLNVSGWDTVHVTNISTMFNADYSLNTLVLGRNTLKTNIFEESLPSYDKTWAYIAQDAAAASPLPLKTEKKDGTLFTAYDFNKMGGTWFARPLAESVTIKNSSGTNITGQSVTSKTQTYQLKASAAPADAVQTFTWKSSDTAVATVSSAGIVTFKTAGTVRISAVSTDTNQQSAYVYIHLPQEATSIVITNSKGTVITGKTVRSNTAKYQLNASAKPSNAEQTVTWKSGNTSIATVSKTGKVTFKKAGTVKITATSTDWGRKTAFVKLKLLPRATKIVIKNADGKTVNGKRVTVKTKIYQLTAAAKPANAAQTVKWTSSNTAVATVSKTGKATFKKAGTVTITATSTDRGKKTGKVKLIYKPAK